MNFESVKSGLKGIWAEERCAGTPEATSLPLSQMMVMTRRVRIRAATLLYLTSDCCWKEKKPVVH